MDKDRLVTSVYDEIAEDYSNLYFDIVEEDIPYLDRFLGLVEPEGKILDVGCGPGGGVKYCLDRGFRPEGIDISPRMIDIARKKVPEGKFRVMDMEKLDYPDEEFDGLILAHSLIHIPSDKIPKVLTELTRVLKPEGFVLFLALKGEPDKIVEEPLKPGAKIFLNLFTQERLVEFITNSDLEVVFQDEVAMVNTDGTKSTGICVIAKTFQ